MVSTRPRRSCLAGQSLRVGVVGGSVSAGHGVDPHPEWPTFPGSYSRVLYEWLDAACPHAENTYINGALGGVGSMHYSQCLWRALTRPPALRQHLRSLVVFPPPKGTGLHEDGVTRSRQSIPDDMDFVLVEFAVNEGNNPSCDGSMELIVRRLMVRNPLVTVVIVNWHDHWCVKGCSLLDSTLACV